MQRELMMERFSIAYISAVAARAGFEVVEPQVDRQSVDGKIISSIGRCPTLDFQAKATTVAELRDLELPYALPVKNYRDLRKVEITTPRILIVVSMPRNEKEWLSQTEEHLCMRKCGYWLSLYGSADIENASSITVHLPRHQIFDADQLCELMRRAEKGPQL